MPARERERERPRQHYGSLASATRKSSCSCRYVCTHTQPARGRPCDITHTAEEEEERPDRQRRRPPHTHVDDVDVSGKTSPLYVTRRRRPHERCGWEIYSSTLGFQHAKISPLLLTTLQTSHTHTTLSLSPRALILSAFTRTASYHRRSLSLSRREKKAKETRDGSSSSREFRRTVATPHNNTINIHSIIVAILPKTAATATTTSPTTHVKVVRTKYCDLLNGRCRRKREMDDRARAWTIHSEVCVNTCKSLHY